MNIEMSECIDLQRVTIQTHVNMLINIKQQPNYFQVTQFDAVEKRLLAVAPLRTLHRSPPEDQRLEIGDLAFYLSPDGRLTAYSLSTDVFGELRWTFTRVSAADVFTVFNSEMYAVHTRIRTLNRRTVQSIARVLYEIIKEWPVVAAVESLIIRLYTRLDDDKETFDGRLPPPTSRRSRRNWMMQLKTKMNNGETIDLLETFLHHVPRKPGAANTLGRDRNSAHTVEYLYSRPGTVDEQNGLGDVDKAQECREEFLRGLDCLGTLSQDIIMPFGHTLEFHAREPTVSVQFDAGTGTFVEAYLMRVSVVELAAAAQQPLFTSPIGYRIMNNVKGEFRVMNGIPLRLDDASAEFWAWPHYFMTEIASLLVEGCVDLRYLALWIIQWLPNMANWNELQMLRALDGALEIRRKVRAKRLVESGSPRLMIED
jgi:hypothetical protein